MYMSQLLPVLRRGDHQCSVGDLLFACGFRILVSGMTLKSNTMGGLHSTQGLALVLFCTPTSWAL